MLEKLKNIRKRIERLKAINGKLKRELQEALEDHRLQGKACGSRREVP